MASSGPRTLFIKRIVGACAVLAAASSLAACDRPASPGVAQSGASLAPAVIAEAYLTLPVGVDANIDSVAVWRKGSPALLLATAKTGNVIYVHDASTGASIRSFGSTGTGAGELRRPNGILVLDDYAFVVERDNHRVQVFALPGGQPVMTFGDVDLRRPYGITGFVDRDGYLRLRDGQLRAS